jgi:hypothetical protein
MQIKSSWMVGALVGLMGFVPATAEAQIRQSTTIERRSEQARQRAESQRADAQRAEGRRAIERRADIYNRDDISRKRNCAHLSKSDKARCKELRKEEHRRAKLEKRRQHCLARHQSNPSHPHCDGVYGGRSSVIERLPDVIYGGDVRRPRGTDPASGVLRRLPRSGL